MIDLISEVDGECLDPIDFWLAAAGRVPRKGELWILFLGLDWQDKILQFQTSLTQFERDLLHIALILKQAGKHAETPQTTRFQRFLREIQHDSEKRLATTREYLQQWVQSVERKRIRREENKS